MGSKRKIPTSLERPIQAAIVFVDATDSVAASHVLGPRDYDEQFLKPLQGCYRQVLYTFRLAKKPQEKVQQFDRKRLPKYTKFSFEADVRGDQMVAMFFSGEIHRDVRMAVWLALETVCRWKISTKNSKRILDGMEPHEVRAGVHVGPITFRERPYGMRYREDRTAEGYAINFAKRVESKAEEGIYTRVMLTRAAWMELESEKVSDLDCVLAEERPFFLKGIGNIPLREVKCFFPPETIFTYDRVEVLKALYKQQPSDLLTGIVLCETLKENRQKNNARRICAQMMRHARQDPFLSKALEDYLNEELK